MNQRKVLLAGTTGLMGGLMLQALLADRSVREVHAPSRRLLKIRHPKLQVHLIDFDRLPELPPVTRCTKPWAESPRIS